MAKFTDFLAGCVVGGMLISTGVLLAKRSERGEAIHVSLTKDDSTAIVWAVDRGTGQARFVSFAAVPPEATEAMAKEAWRKLGVILAGAAAGEPPRSPDGSISGKRP